MSIITWNPNDKSNSITLSNNNLAASGFTAAYNLVRATEGKTSGKWYFEFVVSGSTSARIWVGFSNNSFTNFSLANNYIRAFELYSPYIWMEGIGVSNYANAGISSENYNKTIGFAVDLNLKTFDIYINNIKLNFSTTVGGTNIKNLSDFGANAIFPIAYTISNGETNTVTAKFSLKDFTYSPPTGFLPYDGNVSHFLIKQNNQYYSVRDNSLILLGAPADDAQKQQWFNDNGVDDLKAALLTPQSDGSKLIDKLDDKFEIRMMKPKD